jgi:prolycopene isomerase
MADEFDVAVIGAGYGGAALAALLTHAGRRVALVDKTPRAGGKTQTLDRRGYRYEMFGAVGIPAVNSRFDELVATLDIAERVPFIVPRGPVAGVRYKAADGTWRASRSSLFGGGSAGDLETVKRVYGVDDEQLGALAAMYAAMFEVGDDDLDALDRTGFSEWARPFGVADSLMSQVNSTLNALFVVPVDRLAASEAVLTLRDAVLHGAGRFHKGGYGQVAEECAAYVVEHGGRYDRSTRVTRVLVEAGRACGIETDKGIVRSRAVVSNAGIQPTVLNLAGTERFPSDYVARVEALEPSWAIAGIRYVFDCEVFEEALVPVFSDQSWLDSERFARCEAGDWPDVPLTVADVASHFDPDLVAVPGHQVANIQVFCSPDPDSSMGAEAVKRAEAVLDELWPELRRHVIRTEPYGARQISLMTRDRTVPGVGGEAVGLAQVVGQVGAAKPDPRTPLAGLYLVGCDAGGRGAGTHQAVDSAFNVAAMVDADLG